MQVSVSGLTDYQFCPYLYYLKRIRGVSRFTPKMRQGQAVHAGTDEVPTELVLDGVKIRGRADFVKDDRVVEIKFSNPVFWSSHHMQASVYAHSLQKRLIEVKYHPLELSLIGKPLDIEEIQQTVRLLKKDKESGVFRPKLGSCYFCGYKKSCRFNRTQSYRI